MNFWKKYQSSIVFYLLACVFSWPFFWWRDLHYESWRAWQVPNIVKNWCIMLGPTFAAIISYFFFKSKHTVRTTLFGSSIKYSLAFYFVPLIVLSIVFFILGDMALGVSVLIIFTFLGFVSIAGEEFGWRWFLHDSLNSLAPWKKYLITGFLWEAWHFTNRTTQGDLSTILMRVGIWLIAVIALSFIIGRAVDISKSVFVATAMHMWVDLPFEIKHPAVLYVLGANLYFWVYLLKTWPKLENNGVRA